MDIKTRLTRCCGCDMGGGLICHEGMRCNNCFDKLEGLREIEQLQEENQILYKKIIEMLGFAPVVDYPLKRKGPINEAQILATNAYESEGRN